MKIKNVCLLKYTTKEVKKKTRQREAEDIHNTYAQLTLQQGGFHLSMNIFLWINTVQWCTCIFSSLRLF